MKIEQGLRTLGVLAAAGVLCMTHGVASAQAPSGSTGQCKDGSYTSAASKSGACRGHKGIQSWFADGSSGTAKSATSTAPAPVTAPATAAPAAAPPPAPAPTHAAAPAQSAPAATTAAKSSTRMSPEARAANTPQAPGGGNGLVWVNTDSKVYHCEGTTFYGKTKAGKYMSEADAKAMGAHADRNKPCTK